MMEHDDREDGCKACVLATKISGLCEGEDVDVVIPAIVAVLCSIVRNYDTRKVAGYVVECVTEAVEEARGSARHLSS